MMQLSYCSFAVITVLGLFQSSSAVEDQREGNERPNLILIMTDEHNFRTLGCYRKTMERRQAYMWGPDVVDTPNIDWIADQGALCTSFYATTPVCSPSRGSLLSGLYPQATAVVSNNIPLSDDVETFAHLLGRQGYATGFAGKWHLDGSGKPQWAPKRKFGFDDNRYMFNRGHWKNLKMGPRGPYIGSTKNNRPVYQVGDADATSFTTDFLIDRTIDFVEKNKARPFCYMVSIPDPHGPDTVRAPYDTMFDHQHYEQPTTFLVDDRAIPQWGKPARKTGFGQSKYYGMVKCIDDNVGRLIEKLKQEGILNKTMIVFTSDHGDLRGEHHRQNKGVPWEGSARVPFLIHLPGKVDAGIVVDQALTSVDFTPTLTHLLGIETERRFHGRDFSRLLDRSIEVGEWVDVGFVRGTGGQDGWLMVVSDRYKLVVSTDDRPWLFDLQRDPDEVVNMLESAAYRSVARELAVHLDSYGRKFNDTRINSTPIAEDLRWLMSGKGPYPGRQKDRK